MKTIQEEYEEAMEEYRKASDKKPQDITFYIKMGDALFAEDLYEEAFETYGVALALDPYCFDAHYCQIRALIELEKYFEAAEQCTHAIKQIREDNPRMQQFIDLHLKIRVLQAD